jgi:2-C-methyl-D-erythritol 4-phosphate cytidylyltransferase
MLSTALKRILDRGEMVTDDAQAVEKSGYHPMLITGHADNIKVTCPEDIELAEFYIQQQERSSS